MTDRELLELAAKAAGIEYDDFDEDRQCDIWFLPDACRYDAWNPLTDDGDALRLAVALSIGVRPKGPTHWQEPNSTVSLFDMGEDKGGRVTVYHGDDPAAATRRAIVRAAAEIGKAMP